MHSNKQTNRPLVSIFSGTSVCGKHAYVTGVVITPHRQDGLALPRVGWDVEADDAVHPLTGDTGESRAGSQASLKMEQGSRERSWPLGFIQLVKE